MIAKSVFVNTLHCNAFVSFTFTGKNSLTSNDITSGQAVGIKKADDAGSTIM